MKTLPRNPARTSFPPGARVVAGLALLALVGLASSSRVGGGGTPGRTTALVAILVGVALVVALAVAGTSASGYAVLRDTRLLWKLAVIGVVTASVAGLLLLPAWRPTWRGPAPRAKCLDPTSWWIHRPDRRAEIARDPQRFCPWGGGGTSTVHGGGGGVSVTLLAALAGGLALVLIAAASAVVIALRRSRRVVGTPIDEEDAIALAVDHSLDDLRRERDVRRAIIACYARMERALALGGAGRRAHEAPFEFLARVLERVAREPGWALTELFERAKFSREPMGAAEKERAITALEALRSQVST